MAYTADQLQEIHRMAHLLAQHQGHPDIRIREMAARCSAVEKLCVAIRKGARNSNIQRAFHTLDKLMIQAVIMYTMDKNQGPPPGWV
jgi:uncharacterized protein (DUF433 family)